MTRWTEILIRLGVCIVVTIIFYVLTIMFPGLIIGTLLGTCSAWALIMGWPVLEWIGERAGGLYSPSDDESRVRPDFSVAEACVHRGEYANAIALFREYSARYPEEITPHVRIAELQMDHLLEVDAAIAELRVALAKAHADETFALVANRLADWLVQHRQDAAGAIALMEQIQQRCPDTRYARGAAARVRRLRAG